MEERKWQVLLVGGSSGIGKTRLTQAIAKSYQAKVIEADDVCLAVKSMTTSDVYPAMHYWYGDIDWQTFSVQENVEYLCKVSKELSEALKVIIESHRSSNRPLIIEGDFISVDLAASFCDDKIKSIYVHEPDESQIIKNYLSREGGDPQTFRARISSTYGKVLKHNCDELDMRVIESRPWHTLMDRALEAMG